MKERQLARALNGFLSGQGAETSGGPLCGAWQQEDRGCNKVKVIMDSGAAESVCPRSMAPRFAVKDSIGSRAWIYYTSANVGTNLNLGEQQVPVRLSNGAKTIATFQVADVSRPLMSVGKLCEMGNRVIFGANGGVILNLRSGQVTPFVKDEGVYSFEMWILPLAESPFWSAAVATPQHLSPKLDEKASVSPEAMQPSDEDLQGVCLCRGRGRS